MQKLESNWWHNLHLLLLFMHALMNKCAVVENSLASHLG